MRAVSGERLRADVPFPSDFDPGEPLALNTANTLDNRAAGSRSVTAWDESMISPTGTSPIGRR